MTGKDWRFIILVTLGCWIATILCGYINLFPVTSDTYFNCFIGTTMINGFVTALCSCYVISRCTKSDNSDQKPKDSEPPTEADDHPIDS